MRSSLFAAVIGAACADFLSGRSTFEEGDALADGAARFVVQARRDERHLRLVVHGHRRRRSIACSSHHDLRSEAEFASALRPDTPRAM